MSVLGLKSIGAAGDVPVERTPVSRVELRDAIARAYVRVTGTQASPGVLQALTAQASVETGSGQSMYNFNFGGVKGAGPHGQSANALTHEVIDGTDRVVRQRFRAYDTLDEGAQDYVRLMTHRFQGALPAAASGNLDGFAHALKQAGYYTASEADYASALKSAADPPGSIGPPSTGSPSAGALPTSVDVSRVFDALSRSALRIAEPPERD